MITSFPVDYMHQACLGVTKKLLLQWTKTGSRAVRMSAQQQSQVSGRMLALKDSIPSDFARSPRSLRLLERWKATEFRQFMLYTGKLALKGILRSELYEHFVIFSVAMNIIVCPELVMTQGAYAHDLLRYFVNEARILYGDEFMVYNVHSLLHMAEDATKFNSLDNCSAFPFENYLHGLKRLVRSGKNPLAQVAKRLAERQCTGPPTKAKRRTTLKRDNSYILENRKCTELLEILDDNLALCRVYKNPVPLFTVPCQSFLVDVYQFKKQNSCIEKVPVPDLRKRAIRIEKNGGNVVFMGVLHSM
nr:uncharacterized protein LOC129167214 [Nothobranchius furzeri]